MRARELLGVSRAATPRQIREAFIQRAKSAHPDLGGREHEFRQLVAAYYTLMRNRNEEGDGSVASESTAFHPSVRDTSDEPATERIARLADRLPQFAGEEVKSAVSKAINGPPIPRGQLPPDFEAQERVDVGHEDLLQLCSGRTLLGCVREPRKRLCHSLPTHLSERGGAAGGGSQDELEVVVERGRECTASRSKDDEGETIRVTDHSGNTNWCMRRVGRKLSCHGAEASFAFIRHTTPLVEHWNGFDHRGRAVCRMRRAWQPRGGMPGLLEPRAASHSGPFWFVEDMPGKRKLDRGPLSEPIEIAQEGGVPAPILALIAGFRSADLEKDKGFLQRFLGHFFSP